MRLLAAVLLSLALCAPLSAQAPLPANAAAATPAANINTNVPEATQEREAAISRGMLIGTMAVVLLVLAVVGGLAVFITRRHQAAPEMKDL